MISETLQPNYLSEVCPIVATEPTSQPVTNEFHCSANNECGARLEVRAQGFVAAPSATVTQRLNPDSANEPSTLTQQLAHHTQPMLQSLNSLHTTLCFVTCYYISTLV